MTISVCVLLWARPGAHDELVVYEDEVLALLPSHGARVVERVRTKGEPVDEPFEVHVLEFESTAAFDAYLADPRRAALADRRDRAVARTEVLEVERR